MVWHALEVQIVGGAHDTEMSTVSLEKATSGETKKCMRLEPGLSLQAAMSNMVNEAYRKSRGTDKPFTVSEEQAKAIWNELIRKEKPQYYRKPTPAPETSPKA